MKIIIVGGVAGGATAAARLRRRDEDALITIYERSGYMSYANCGLPYYIGGEIVESEKLTLQTPQSFKKRFNVDVRVKHEVQQIIPEKKKVVVKNLDNGNVFEDTYDKLILSPGAKPIGTDIAGADIERVFTIRTVEDTFRISDFIKINNPKTAVVVGGGFIGIEMTENLIQKGIDVTLVESLEQVLSPFDFDMACQVQVQLSKKGVKLKLKSKVEEFIDSGNKVKVNVGSGGYIDTDMVVLAIGVKPDSSLAYTAGLEIGPKGSIVVNEYMQTSNADIYAVGDAIQFRNPLSGEIVLTPLAGPANKQARIVADNICGEMRTYSGAIGTSIVKVFNLTAAVAGLNERTLKKTGIEYDKVVIMPSSHASYYPGSGSMVLKVLFTKKEGKILGAQITGFDGVDKRIDVLSTAIKANMTAFDLVNLDLAYAPPYSSAKDPVNMVGYVIQNVVEGKVKQYHWDEVESLPRDGSVTLLDVRTKKEYERGNIKGFVNIPLDSLREQLDKFPKEKAVYVHCQSALRSYIACRLLSQKGYDCWNLSGGYGFYSAIINNEHQPEKGLSACGMI